MFFALHISGQGRSKKISDVCAYIGGLGDECFEMIHINWPGIFHFFSTSKSGFFFTFGKVPTLPILVLYVLLSFPADVFYFSINFLI